MPRNGAITAEAIRGSAIRLFCQHGYEATSLRDLASDVGIKVGSLYNHISSKEELLYSIMSGIMRDLLDEVNAALATQTEPVDRLRTAVELHVAFHAVRSQEVFIGNSELRALPPVKRAAVVEQRDEYEQLLRKIVSDGVDAGVFHVSDVRLATYGIVAIGTQVADWYQPGGRMSLAEIATVYSDFVLRSLTNDQRQVELGQMLAPLVSEGG
ncbi:HTH-type transcriptional repressor KstR2 [Baekduia alba]|uniref:TetR/AcrR family transcriptional regulator n=1 Tax=Baekduia alba TaxID=2997333 RepID=UPI00234251DC|nr:TetR/AcrR family transcriptional regulator [Baekduia alba]WCB95389.1 HTH-type transcriptional repressor KstR2 [Baekduia alba]